MTIATNSDTRVLRLGLIGAGLFAQSAHVNAILPLQAAGKVDVRFVWSRSEASSRELAAKYGTSVRLYGAVGDEDADQIKRQMTDDSLVASARAAIFDCVGDIDAVVIAVPIPQAAAFCEMALSLRLPVFCEKPIAHDVDAARKLLVLHATLRKVTPELNSPIAAVQSRYGLAYAVGENFRFEAAFRHAAEMITSVCGDVVSLRLCAQSPMGPGSRYGFGWRLALKGVGILCDGVVHHVAGLRVLARSDVALVSASCSRRSVHFEGCDTASGTLTFENGLEAAFFVTYAAATFVWECVVVGTHGEVTVKRDAAKPGGYTVLGRINQGVISERFFKFEGIEREFEMFVEGCEAGYMHEDLRAEAAFNDLATVEAMLRSSNAGAVVEVAQPTEGDYVA